MRNSNKLKFTIVLLIIGFMTAIQYNTMKTPEERDTRDIWAIRQELSSERQVHSELLSEIRELDQTLRTYTSLDDEDTGKALMETVDKLNAQAGMSDAKGPGMIIEVAPSLESMAYGLPIEEISPDLLTRFINDINQFKGNSIEIDGKRYTILSSIRDINGRTTVNGLNISSPPFTIKIISQSMADSEKLYNYLLASSIHDDFILDNLVLKIGKPKKDVEIHGWHDHFENLYMNELPKGD